jgi:hypothetical protein
MGKFICKICGAEENTERWFNVSDLEKHQMCQSCNHWREQHELDKYERGEHGYAIFAGTHYTLLPHTDAQIFRGFGGRKFTVKFSDGYETVCDNVRCQGDIPEGYWRDKMPDNVEFIIS